MHMCTKREDVVYRLVRANLAVEFQCCLSICVICPQKLHELLLFKAEHSLTDVERERHRYVYIAELFCEVVTFLTALNNSLGGKSTADGTSRRSYGPDNKSRI